MSPMQNTTFYCKKGKSFVPGYENGLKLNKFETVKNIYMFLFFSECSYLTNSLLATVLKTTFQMECPTRTASHARTFPTNVYCSFKANSDHVENACSSARVHAVI